MIALSVNLNAVAQLRNRRNLPWPSVMAMARLCLDAGAEGITVHPRPDQRHIRRTDVFELAELLRGEYPGRELNVEGYPSPAFLSLCAEIRPDQVTLVPDAPGQATSDHGWDIASGRELLGPVVESLRQGGMRVSLFIDPDPASAGGAAALGAQRVELYTGPYGNPDNDSEELDRLRMTASAAIGAGLGVNAGHDLTLANLPPLLAAVPGLSEVSIGHAITADALVHGFAEAVRRYRAILAG